MGRSIKKFREADGQLIEETAVRYINAETGEEVWLQGVQKTYFGAKHFWKMYLIDFLAVLGIIESKQLDVICYIMENTNPSNNQFQGTLKEIAEACGCTPPTVQEAINKLLAADFMTKTKYRSTYIVNADVMVKGSEAKKRGLMITYQEEKTEATKRAAKKAGCLPDQETLPGFEDNRDIIDLGEQ